jgi:large subunit ribosomal protein L13
MKVNSSYFPISPKPVRQWHVVDAKDVPLGRVATRVATLLRGKHKPSFSPYLDEGDFVIVINAASVKLTGNKLEQKVAFSHSIYPGGLKLVPYKRLMAEKPERAVVRAVNGMLCKNKLRARMLTRLKVYRDASHRHGVQQPKEYALS